MLTNTTATLADLTRLASQVSRSGSGADLRVGDVVDFLGQPIRVDRLEPYPADRPVAAVLGPGAWVAYGPGRFAITVPARLPFTVHLPRPPAYTMS